MKIEHVLVLRDLFSDFLDKTPCDVLLVNATTSVWREELLLAIKNLPNSNAIVLTCMLVNRPEAPGRIDALFMACKRDEINDNQYLNEISYYLNIDGDRSTSILEFLNERWKSDPASHALTFWWTTRTDSDANYTVIADCAVAPAYQGHHLMKLISLKLVDMLQKTYGSDHKLISTPIHPATYLLFNPYDKSCRRYSPGVLEDISCVSFLRMHGKRPPISLTIEGLCLNSMFKCGDLRQTFPPMITGRPAPLLITAELPGTV